MRKGLSGAIADMDQVGRRNAAKGQQPTADQEALDRAAIYRSAQTRGSIDYLERPGPQEPDASVVIIASGDGVVLRCAMGRNRTVNFIQQLLATLV